MATSQRSLNMYEGVPLVDADTTDYWDDNGGLPPPHRLSSQFGHSPYLAGNASPRQSYVDPFSNSAAAHAITGSFDLDRPRDSLQGVGTSYPPRGSIDMSSSQHQGASYAFANAGATPYGRVETNDDEDTYAAGSAAAPLWGRSESTPTAQRERYLARREQANADEGAAGYVYHSEKPAMSFVRRRKWWLIGAAVLALVIIVAAAAGVAVAKSNNKKAASEGATGVVTSDKDDPSVFTKDPALKQSFYGFAYTPLNSQYPACGDTLDAVIEDIQLLSQLTTRIRIYGADCNVPGLVLEAINKTKVDMTVWLAVWVPQPIDDPQGVTYARQVAAVQQAITTWGVDHVGGVTVGNEFLLNGGSESELITKMSAMRTLLAGMGLSKTIPVGTADAGSMVTTTLGAGSDYIMANVHAWFGSVPIAQAAGWTWNYMANQEPASAQLAATPPQMFIAETGWPSGANETAFETLGPAVAGIPEINEFLATFVCAANANITAGDIYSPYFYFEFADEPWKDPLYGGVEAHWGIFDSSKKLKAGIVLPDCTHP